MLPVLPAAGREPIPFSLMTGCLVGLDREELREKAAALAYVRALSNAERKVAVAAEAAEGEGSPQLAATP